MRSEYNQGQTQATETGNANDNTNSSKLITIHSAANINDENGNKGLEV